MNQPQQLYVYYTTLSEVIADWNSDGQLPQAGPIKFFLSLLFSPEFHFEIQKQPFSLREARTVTYELRAIEMQHSTHWRQRDAEEDSLHRENEEAEKSRHEFREA